MDSNDNSFAENLKKVFCIIESPEQIALHNDMVYQIKALIGDNENTKEFRKRVAVNLKNRPKNYLKSIASLIKQYAMKGANSGS